jgi:hypothetical protein
MTNIIGFLKKYYWLLVLIPVLLMRFGIYNIWATDNIIMNIICIPVLILIIYLSFSDLVENDSTSGLFRRIAFDIGIIAISLITICQTAYMIVKYFS